MLRLPDHWVWDSWLAQDAGTFHLFFLRASRALVRPERRHIRAAVGHAVSADLRSWRLMPDALVHTERPAFDQHAVWTGSVIRGDDGRWYQFFTGVTRVDAAPIQRIGLAISDDLIAWRRASSRPIVRAVPRWYDCIGGEFGVSEAWRDPYVFADPGGDGWHMLITARAPGGHSPWRAVIGHARSADLLHWQVEPPLTEPGVFHDMEVAQVQFIDGQAVLVFSCPPAGVAPERRRPGPGGATWTIATDSLERGWAVDDAVAFAHPSLYSGRLVRDVDGEWSLIGFRNIERGRFYGEILDPVPVAWKDGRLVPSQRRVVAESLGYSEAPRR
jgi:beta-fructofuranosidase